MSDTSSSTLLRQWYWEPGIHREEKVAPLCLFHSKSQVRRDMAREIQQASHTPKAREQPAKNSRLSGVLPRNTLPIKDKENLCLEPCRSSRDPVTLLPAEKNLTSWSIAALPSFFPNNIPLCPPRPPSIQTLQGSLTHNVFIPLKSPSMPGRADSSYPNPQTLVNQPLSQGTT